MESARSQIRDRINKDVSLPKIKKKPSKKISPENIKVGDSVFVVPLGLKGTVSTLPNSKGDLFVQMGILRSQVNIKDLEPAEAEDKKPEISNRTQSGKIRMSKSASIKPEINLIGKTVDEAIFELEKYLDDAYLAHLPQVTVIHGRGTGALRNAVHTYLKKSKYVKDFRIGGYNEGNTGATIVEFK